jgi:hypothetical protein
MVDLSRSQSVVLTRTYTRPCRVCVVIPVDSARQFNNAVRAVVSTWGGTRSLIVTGTREATIGEQWLPLLNALDPDAVFVHPALGGVSARNRLRSWLSRKGLAPFWIAPFSAELIPEEDWRFPSASPPADDEASGQVSAESLSSPTSVEVAVLGLAPNGEAPKNGKVPVGAPERRALTSPAVFVAASPAVAAARDVPGFRTRPIGNVPFVYHERDDVETAIWLWNIRAIRGAYSHGGDVELGEWIANLPPTRVPRQVIYIDAVPVSVRQAIAASTRPIRLVAARRTPWTSVVRPVIGGFTTEVDEVPSEAGRFELPRRAPRVTGLGGSPESALPDGAYTIEVDATPADSSGLRASYPARASTLGIALQTPQTFGTWTSLGGLSTRSRYRRQGDLALAVLPVRWPRTARLELPAFDRVLRAVAPTYEFGLSDKGHYSRWVIARVGGLAGFQALMTDARGQAILRTFRSHHRGPGKPSGAYRRFLTLDEMRETFTQERRAGRLGKRIRNSPPDDEWLRGWIGTLVRSGLLRSGIWTRCDVCLAGSFIPLGAASETYSCPRCGTVGPTPPVPRLGYRLAEVAHLFFANDCDVSALALSALSRRSRGGFTYDFDQNVVGSGQKNEVDFTAVVDGQLYVGESKKGGQFDGGDFAFLTRLARVVSAHAVVLATNTGCEGGCTDRCVRDARSPLVSSDSSLPTAGVSAVGPREGMLEMRGKLKRIGCDVLVLCEGELHGPSARRPRVFLP